MMNTNDTNGATAVNKETTRPRPGGQPTADAAYREKGAYSPLTDFARAAPGMNAVLSEIAERLTSRTNTGGNPISAKKGDYFWEGETWDAELEPDPESGAYLPMLRPSPRQGYSIEMWCRPDNTPSPVGHVSGLRLDIHAAVETDLGEVFFAMDRFGPPITFLTGEHLTSDAADEAVGRVLAIRRDHEKRKGHFMSRKSDKIKSGPDPRQLDMFQMLEGVTINGVPIEDISPADFGLIDLTFADISRVVEPDRGGTRAQPSEERRCSHSAGAKLPEDAPEDAPEQTARGVHDREDSGEDPPIPDYDHKDLELPDD